MNTALRLVSSNLALSGKKDYVNKLISNEPKTGVLFSDFVDITTTRKAKRMGEKYKASYTSVINHLLRFSEINDCNVFTNSVNEEFLDDFICYLEEQNLKLNYIKALIDMIKGMVRKAATYGYAVDMTYDDVTVEPEDYFSVYLSMNEITRIYYFKELTRIQKRTRDLFIVGCLTALRYSDYSTLTRQNFDAKGDFIVKVTKKTGKKVTLPVHDYVKEIYERYDFNIPGGRCIQQFNRAIKGICKKIGFDESITFNYTRGGKLVTETKQKWELISSHTARRSAATNLYLTGRLKTYEIMQLTGHTTEKSFFRYIKVTNEDVSKHVAVDNFFRK